MSEQKGSCWCGRTANLSGNCDGSHGLTEVDWYRVQQARMQAQQPNQQYGGGSTARQTGGGSSVK
jgi:hypothetical protein